MRAVRAFVLWCCCAVALLALLWLLTATHLCCVELAVQSSVLCMSAERGSCASRCSSLGGEEAHARTTDNVQEGDADTDAAPERGTCSKNWLLLQSLAMLEVGALTCAGMQQAG